MNVLDLINGNLLNSFDLGSTKSDSSPVIASDTVYVGAGDGYVYAFTNGQMPLIDFVDPTPNSGNYDIDFIPVNVSVTDDNVDTIVGPSVNVEGDFASEGNIIVKGTVTGSVNTSKTLLVEPGAKIVANVKAGSATIAGEVRGNMKVREYVELTSTARIVGDIEASTIAMEAGALLYGKVAMPGLETSETRGGRGGRSRRSDNSGDQNGA